jgi:hypothetical protein
MPITLTPTNGAGVYGPGLAFNYTSTYPGPLSGPGTLVVDFSNSSEPTTGGFGLQSSGQGLSGGTSIYTDPNNTYTDNNHGFQTDTTVDITVSLRDSTGVVDTGTTTGQWDATTGLGHQAYYYYTHASSGTGGFTATDRSDLQTTLANTNTMATNWSDYENTTLPSLQSVLSSIQNGVTAAITTAGGLVTTTLGQLFSGKTLDTLLSQDIGSGCDDSPIDVTLVGSVFGIFLEITTIPAWYAFTGPAGDYSQQALATLQILRGGQIILRKGIHEVSTMVYPLPGLPNFDLELDLNLVPPQYEVKVWFNTGVCGDLRGQYLP